MLKTKSIFNSYSVKDLKESESFYKEILGLETKLDQMGLQINQNGQQLAFLYPKGDSHEPASFTVLNLIVEDIDEAVAYLKSKGIRLEHYEDMPHQDEDGIMRSTAPEDGPTIAWFKDPSGNILSLIEE